MKAIGVVRKLDEMGRLVLPKELRITFNLKEKDAVEIFVEEKEIILRKYEPSCLFCGNAKDISTYKEKKICINCLNELKNIP